MSEGSLTNGFQPRTNDPEHDLRLRSTKLGRRQPPPPPDGDGYVEQLTHDAFTAGLAIILDGVAARITSNG